MLASEADREATLAVLKQAFEDQRLMLDEFQSRVGRALAARTQGELAQLTRDIPTGPAAPVTGGRAPARLRPNRWGKEEPRHSRFRLVPPELCPSCGEEMAFHHDGRCHSCGNQSLARAKRVPRVIQWILVTLPMLEDGPGIQEYVTRAPQGHDAILALTAAIADAGVRIRDTHPKEDVRDSGVRHLSTDDIWMLDLTLDIMCMLAKAGTRGHKFDSSLEWRVEQADKETHDRRWQRALRQAGAGPAQFRQLRAHVPPRASYPR
jgi:hypothetical protein